MAPDDSEHSIHDDVIKDVINFYYKSSHTLVLGGVVVFNIVVGKMKNAGSALFLKKIIVIIFLIFRVGPSPLHNSLSAIQPMTELFTESL